jgi:protein-S-isoprenylcysteine O-methyltransferase Ste14
VQLPQTLIHWLLAGSAAAAVIFFAAGLTTYFEVAPNRRWWVRLIHDAGPLLSLAHLAGVVLLPPRSDASAAAGILLYSLAVAVFLSAIESAKRTRLQRAFVDHPLPDRLITDGPYRWIRHPFYLGYIAGAVAAPVATASIVLNLIAIAMVGLTLSAAVREERAWLRSPRGEAYRHYQSKTGMFLPFIGRR